MSRYAVVGTGAVGGFIGLQLLAAGHEVQFVARSNFAAVSATGLTLRRDGVATKFAEVNVVSSVGHLSPVDVLVVTTKSTDISDLSRQIARAHPSTTIVAFHNGLDPESLYLAADSQRILLGGVAYMTGVLESETTIGVNGMAHFLVGAPDPTDDRAATEAITLVADFCASGLNASVSSELGADRWRKTAWSLIFAGPCTILDMDTRELVESEDARELQRQIFAEARAVASTADGVLLAGLQEMVADALSSPGHLVSMTVDRRSGRPTEEDAIYGEVRRRATAMSIPTPVLDVVHLLLRADEKPPSNRPLIDVPRLPQST